MCVEGGNSANTRVRRAAPFRASKDLFCPFRSFASLGVAEPLQRALAAENYRQSDPDPDPGHSAGAFGPRRARHRADRHRQDRRVRPAAAPASRRAPRSIRSARRARAHPGARRASSRSRSTTACESYGRNLKLRYAVILGGVNQNKQVSARAQRRRHPRRHARTPARSRRSEARSPQHGEHAHHRRSRPHVRHGLPARRAPDRVAGSAGSASRCCSPPRCRPMSPSSCRRS